MVNNQGIVHLKLGNRQVACRNQRAHIYVPFERYGEELHTCKRCNTHYQKMLTIAARKAAVKLADEKS